MQLEPCTVTQATAPVNSAAAGRRGLIGTDGLTAAASTPAPQASRSTPTAAHRRLAGSGRSLPSGQGASRTIVVSDQKTPASQRDMAHCTS